jgi:hypothetical protein
MCLNCGCMHAHDDMGKPGINITYEGLKRAADANTMTVDAALATITKTAGIDRADHAGEYGSVAQSATTIAGGARA